MHALTVDRCGYQAARYAVLNWHYSRTMPAGKLARYGAWEHGRFIGAVLFGRGATPKIGSPYDLDQTEICELVRVALRPGHHAPTSQIVAAAISQLHREHPGLRLIVSFADTERGHIGTLYQAGNWTYAGALTDSSLIVHGREMHRRSVYARWGHQSVIWLRQHVDPNATIRPQPTKHRYLYPLDKAMRRRIATLAQPYPRGRSVDGDTADPRSADAGSTPADRSRITA